jgi:hypothetical protein
MEQMEQQNRATYEAVMAVEGRLMARLDPELRRIGQRLDALEAAVRLNSEDIRKNSQDIQKNSQDIEAMRRELIRLGIILGADRDENAIQALERRVEAIERRLGM